MTAGGGLDHLAKKWSNSAYVLQVELTVFLDGLDVWCGEERDQSTWVDGASIY